MLLAQASTWPCWLLFFLASNEIKVHRPAKRVFFFFVIIYRNDGKRQITAAR